MSKAASSSSFHVWRAFLRMAFLLAAGTLLSTGCVSGKKLEIEGAFPVPILAKAPVRLGLHLDDELLQYTHTETIEKKGEWEVAVGPIQEALFATLAEGVFEAYELVDEVAAAGLDGVLKPSITEVQFSLPAQTRSTYYEVWIRYNFQLYDRLGNLVGTWDLPAYGKANNRDFGSSTNGLEAAAMAACRDAMAFFSINFAREPVVRKWIDAGMPAAAPANGDALPNKTAASAAGESAR